MMISKKLLVAMVCIKVFQGFHIDYDTWLIIWCVIWWSYLYWRIPLSKWSDLKGGLAGWMVVNWWLRHSERNHVFMRKLIRMIISSDVYYRKMNVCCVTKANTHVRCSSQRTNRIMIINNQEFKYIINAAEWIMTPPEKVTLRITY